MELSDIAANVEEIVEREVRRIKDSNVSLDEKSIRVLESLSKVLDHCIERRKGVKPVDPYDTVSTEELNEQFP